MSKISTNITIDSEVKQVAKLLYSKMGMDLSTAISIFLTQSIIENGMPFKPTLNVPNKETIEAINELPEMKSNKNKYKRYNSVDDAFKDALK